MEKVNKYLGYAILMFIIFWIGRTFYKNNQLKSDYKFTKGKVNDIVSSGWKGYGDYSLLYDYTIDGVKYASNVNYKLCDGLTKGKVRASLMNKFFPVAYSAKDITQSVILITQEDAAMFKYTIADSLLVYDSILMCK
jgi:hypothetical protein